MNSLQVLLLALTVALSESISFKVANKYVVTIVSNTNGVPNHLNFSQAFSAIKQVLTGTTGTIVVGDVSLTVALIKA